MSKKKLRKTAKAAQTNDRQRKMSLITLGKPEPILTTLTDYQKIWYDNDYDHYTLPIDRLALAQLTNMNGQHGGIIYSRHNMIASDYLGGGLSHEQFKSAVINFLIFGDVSILKVRNFWGDIVRLEVLPSLYLRRRKDGDFVVLQEGE
ncbi:phage portal protein, partial [Xenorhabdus griffiniae]|nr:phage portal protein [Xenorhabdus griffiniae]